MKTKSDFWLFIMALLICVIIIYVGIGVYADGDWQGIINEIELVDFIVEFSKGF